MWQQLGQSGKMRKRLDEWPEELQEAVSEAYNTYAMTRRLLAWIHSIQSATFVPRTLDAQRQPLSRMRVIGGREHREIATLQRPTTTQEFFLAESMAPNGMMVFREWSPTHAVYCAAVERLALLMFPNSTKVRPVVSRINTEWRPAWDWTVEERARNYHRDSYDNAGNPIRRTPPARF